MDYTDAEYRQNYSQRMTNQNMKQPQETTTHDVPRCTCCGHVGPWKEDPVFRPIDYVLTVFFLLLGIIPGIIYALVIFAIRGGKRGDAYRTKYCTNCGAKNMFTFIY